MQHIFETGGITKEGTVTSLGAKLDAASISLQNANTTAAINQLSALMHQVWAQNGTQPGKSISFSSAIQINLEVAYLASLLAGLDECCEGRPDCCAELNEAQARRDTVIKAAWDEYEKAVKAASEEYTNALEAAMKSREVMEQMYWQWYEDALADADIEYNKAKAAADAQLQSGEINQRQYDAKIREAAALKNIAYDEAWRQYTQGMANSYDTYLDQTTEAAKTFSDAINKAQTEFDAKVLAAREEYDKALAECRARCGLK